MTNTNTIVDTLCDFIAYVDSFYNEKTGIYPIKGMTNSMVIKGVQKYITQIGEGTDHLSGVEVIRLTVNVFVTLSSLITDFSGDKSLILLKKKTSKKMKKRLDLLSEHCYNDYRN